MNKFETQNYNIPKLIGISEKTIEEHLKLYAGYVKFANQIQDSIVELKKDAEKNVYILGELKRRFAFEYNGMRNHEIYFSSLLEGYKSIDTNSELYKKISNTWDSFDSFLNEFKSVALTRGIGWAMLTYDRKSGNLMTNWVDEQHLGQLNNTNTILALDMWEHSYVTDYQPSGKKNYVEDFFKNINWSIIEQNYNNVIN